MPLFQTVKLFMNILGAIKSTNVLMPWWWLQGPPNVAIYHTWPHTDWIHACMQVTVANQCSQVQLVYLSRTVGVGYVHRRLSSTISTCIIWACARLTRHHQWCKQRAQYKAAMLWRACSQDFTRVAVYLVVQMELSRWKVVCCGQLTLRWTLDRWQRPSRWAHHAVTRQQSLKSKI